MSLTEGVQHAILTNGDQIAFVGNFVVLAEIIDIDGEDGMFVGHNVDIAIWRELGLLNSRLEDIRAGGFTLFDEVLEED